VALGGAALQSSGNKKAAKNGAPQLPDHLRGPMFGASRLFNTLINQGVPRFGGQFAAPLTGLQRQSQGFAGRTLAQGELGLQDAIQTTQVAAEKGFNAEDIDLARQLLQPLRDIQRQEGIANITEQAALGGRTFGTGRANTIQDFLRGSEAQFNSQLLPFAQDMSRFRLGAAQSLPGLFAQGLGLAGAGQQIGEVERGINQQEVTGRFNEFLRTQPQELLKLLPNLFGAPMQVNPVAPNFGQVFGSALGGLAGNQGFLNFLGNAFGGGGGVGSAGVAGQVPGQGTGGGFL
jgi:hypothetical protein